jgi:amidase
MTSSPSTARARTDELALLDATAQAALVRSGEVTALELVDAAIARIDRVDPHLNAVVIRDFDAARAAAASPDLPDGPFRGVPLLLKDFGANQQGMPTYLGNRLLRDLDHRADADTELGARFRRAGLVTLGKTNLPELGSGPTTQPLSFGPTNNPWDPARSPAGSSGGAAAAVAAGLVPVAHANDGGGSIRLPAAWCGLVGLKPSRGRMPSPEWIDRQLVELVVSRTVRDTAAVLDATHGSVPADLYQLAPPAGPYVDELGREPGELRIALLTDGAGYDVDPACVAAATDAATLLEQMGHHVEPVDGSVLFGGDGRVNGSLWMVTIARHVDWLSDLAGRPLTVEEVEPYNWAAAERHRALPARAWLADQERQQAWSRWVLDWFADFDVLLSPTAACPALPTDELWPSSDRPWKIGETYGRIGRFTLPFNATGQPAISLPLHRSADDLPVGVQLVAGMGREDLLLRLAARLEEAVPWADVRPQVHA